MKRKRYPSDHRRWFRLMEDVLDDPGYRNLSPIEKVTWIDLLALFNRYQAHRTLNCIVLPWSRAFSVIGTRNKTALLKRARRISAQVGVRFCVVPEGLMCFVPAWSKMQGLEISCQRCVSQSVAGVHDPCTKVAPPPATVVNTPLQQVEVPDFIEDDSRETPTTTPTPTQRTTCKPRRPARPRGNGKTVHPDAARLAKFFRAELLANVEMWTPPRSLYGWTEEFDRMLRLDGPKGEGIDTSAIERVIHWVVRDDFEAKNVQSPRKLRKRFASLWAKAKPEEYFPDIEAHKRERAESEDESDENQDTNINNLTPQERAMLGRVEF